MNIFVLTSEKTAIRRKQIDGLVEDIRQEFPSRLEYISDYDPSDDQPKFVKEFVSFDKLESPLDKYNRYLKPLHPAQVSNLRKHMEALRRAAAATKPSLILEDDAISGENFLGQLKKCFGDGIPEGWDAVMLGLPGKAPGFHRLSEYFPVLPVCDSYLVSPEGAKKIVDEFLPIKFMTNIHLSYVFEKTGASVYMITPNVFLDSSKYGVYASTVSPNNPLILNRQYVETRMMIRDDEKLEQNKDKVYEALTTNQFKNHPDFMHLRALYEHKVNGAEAAQLVYSTALKVYDSCNATLNNESEFLKDYISLYSELQD